MSAILLSSLAKMGYRDDPRVAKYIRAALSSQMPGGGWDCYGESIGVLESCPMDDLNILMLLGQYEQHINNPGLYGAIDLLLEHWEDGRAPLRVRRRHAVPEPAIPGRQIRHPARPRCPVALPVRGREPVFPEYAGFRPR